MAITVTATQGGSTANGMLLRVEVLTGAAVTQNGATAAHDFTATTTSFTQSLTTTVTGSWVYGAAEHGPNHGAATANGSSAMIDDVLDATHNVRYCTFKSLAATGTPGATTFGFTFTGADTGPWAAAEILPAGTIAEDASAPAVVSTTTATTVSTAAFTPPPGSLLVALVASDGGAAQTTMTVSDGTLTWTELVKANASGDDYAGVWIAQVPPAGAAVQLIPPGLQSPMALRLHFPPPPPPPPPAAPAPPAPVRPLASPIRATRLPQRGGTAAARVYPKFLDWFDGYSAISGACLANSTTFGRPPWTVLWGSTGDGGCTQITGPDGAYSTVAELKPATATSSGQTFSAVLTGPQASGNFEFSALMRTVAQLRTGSAPNNWETAWIFWDWKFPDPSGSSGYYYTIKESGTEIGRLNNGTQTVLATSGNNLNPGVWHHVHVVQTAGGGTTSLSVYVDGTLDLSFSDVSGSALTGGQIALYCEDAQVHFTGVALPAIPPPPATSGPPVRQLASPVQGRPAVPQLTGRATHHAGTYAQLGPPVRQLTGPVRAPVPAPPRGGRTATRAGVLQPYALFAGSIGGGGGTQVTVTGSTIPGDGIVVAANTLGGNGCTGVGDTQGNTYRTVGYDSARGCAVYAATYCGRPGIPTRPLTAGTDKITLLGGFTSGRAVAVGVPGIAPVPFDKAPGEANGNSGAPSGPATGTLTQPGDIVVYPALGTWSTTGAFTFTSPFTPIPGAATAAASNGTAIGWYTSPSTASVTPAGTLSPSAVWVNMPVAFTPASVRTGAPLTAPAKPAAAAAKPAPRGSVTWRQGTPTAAAPQAGPPIYPLGHPLQARVAQPPPGGRVSRRAGVFAGLGPAVRALAAPVTARLRVLPPRGRSTARSGVYAGAGPAVRALAGPVQARRQPAQGGTVTHRGGTYAQLGPPVRQLHGPVRIIPAPPPRGSAQGRAGTFTSTVPASGPPVRQLQGPVRTRPQPPPRGRIVKAAGVYAGTGAPAIPLRQPAGLGRRQPPPPARGRTASQRGPYAQTGPPVVRLRRPVRGQPAKPLLTGRARWRTGTWTAPFVPPFTVGALTATDTPRATQAPTGAAVSSLTASGGPSGRLTANDQRTGGPRG